MLLKHQELGPVDRHTDRNCHPDRLRRELNSHEERRERETGRQTLTQRQSIIHPHSHELQPPLEGSTKLPVPKCEAKLRTRSESQQYASSFTSHTCSGVHSNLPASFSTTRGPRERETHPKLVLEQREAPMNSRIATRMEGRG